MSAKRPHRIGVFTTGKTIILPRFTTNTASGSRKLALHLLLSVTYIIFTFERNDTSWYLIFDNAVSRKTDVFQKQARVIYSKWT